MYGLAASTVAAIALDGQVQEKIAIGDYSGAVDQATYHLPGLGSSRSLVEALSEGNTLGALLSSGSLGAEVLPFIKMLGPGGVGQIEHLAATACNKKINLGKNTVSAIIFHREIKPNIFKNAGNFSKVVGANPDIKIVGGRIILIGRGPFKGKSFNTGLDASDFFEGF